MANGNGNGDAFRVSRATLMIILAVGSPIAGLSVGGYMLRQQVKINEAQEIKIREMEKEAWAREWEIKRLREDVDSLLLYKRQTK